MSGQPFFAQNLMRFFDSIFQVVLKCRLKDMATKEAILKIILEVEKCFKLLIMSINL